MLSEWDQRLSDIPEGSEPTATQEQILEASEVLRKQKESLQESAGNTGGNQANIVDDVIGQDEGEDMGESTSVEPSPDSDTIRETISRFFDQSQTVKDRLIREEIAPLSESNAQRIVEQTGLDIEPGYVHTIDNYAISHAMSSHGQPTELLRGQVPLQKTDFERIPEVIEEFDKVTTHKNKRDQDLLVYEKSFEGGTTIYVEEVRTGNNELAMSTMNKKKGSTGVNHADSQESESPLPTSETSPVFTSEGNKQNSQDNEYFSTQVNILDGPLQESTKIPISLIGEDRKSMFNSVYSVNKGDINHEKLNENTESIQEGVAYINALSLEEEQGRTKGGRANVEASLLVRGSEGASPQEQREIRADQEYQTLTETAESGRGPSQGVRTEVRGQSQSSSEREGSRESENQDLTDSEEREYFSTQINIPEGPLQESILSYVDSIPEEDLYIDGSGKYGAETKPHVTALYGLTAENADQVLELLVGIGPVEISLGETSLFENEQYDVLKIDIDSPDLVRINALLRDNEEYENDYPDY